MATPVSRLPRWQALSLSSSKRSTYRRPALIASTSLVLISGGAAAYLLSHPPPPVLSLKQSTIQSPLDLLDAAYLRETTAHLQDLTASELLRSWITYTICTSSTLVLWSPSIVRGLQSFRDHVPVLGPLTWHAFCGVIRQTMFAAFVGGETAEGCNPTIRKFLNRNISTMVSYAAEIDEASPPGKAGADKYLFTENIDIFRRNITQAAEATSPNQPTPDVKPTWFGVRFNGLTRDPTVLTRLSLALRDDPNCEGLSSSSPHLSKDDHEALHHLYQACRYLEGLARDHGLRVDWASDIWPFQPAIDRLNRMLRDEFDKIGNSAGCDEPTVYNTYQCYLTSSPERLRLDMKHAQEQGTTFGAKLVRGAYLDAENRRAVEQGIVSPCHSTKEATDQCYDELTRIMVDAVLLDIQDNKGPPKVAVAVCTNNVVSVRKVVERLVEAGLMRPEGNKIVVDERLRGRLVFGQLMGMSDSLTSTLAKVLVRPEDAPKDKAALPLVFKLAPWGPVELALPYLLRRALENKSVLDGGPNAGGAVAESQAARKEIWRRLRLS